MALGAQLEQILRATNAAHIRIAAIGGIAVNVHGYVRGTHDLDFLIDANDVDKMAAILADLGYGAIDQRADLSSWVRGFDRIDLIHAQRPIARLLLAAAPLTPYLDSTLHVVDVEGILGLKIQAYSDDPRRLRDLADILELMKRHRANLDLPRLREYFELFDQGTLLDELLRQSST